MYRYKCLAHTRVQSYSHQGQSNVRKPKAQTTSRERYVALGWRAVTADVLLDNNKRRRTQTFCRAEEAELRLHHISVQLLSHPFSLSCFITHTVCMCVSACVCHTVNLSSFLATQITCNMNRFMVGPQSHDLQTSEQPLAVRETCSQS